MDIYRTDERVQGWVLGAAIFLMGGCGLAYEYTFSKLASDLLGNSVQQWAIVIAVMLFCMGVGAELQRFIPKGRVTLTLLTSQAALALCGGFGPILTLKTFVHYPHYFGLIHYGLISLIGVLIGFEIPLISRLNEDYSESISKNLGHILKMDYVGALIGALLWVFLLPRLFNLHEIAYLLGGISISTALLCWGFFKVQLPKSQKHLTLLLLLLTGAALTYGGYHSHHWAVHAEQSLYMDRVIYSTTTPYQHIVLTESKSGTLRCYINGHIQFSSKDEHLYHEHLVHPAMALTGRAERILILGGGDGMAAREVLKHPHVKEVTLVDLDPEMTSLAAHHPILSRLNDYALTDQRVRLAPSSAVTAGPLHHLSTPLQRRLKSPAHNTSQPELHIINIDAVNYLQQTDTLYDVIILDFPDPSSPELAKLYSLPFYRSLKQHLSADGIIVQQSTSPNRAKEAFLCIGRTLAAAGFSPIPYHDHVPSFGEWGWWIASHSDLETPSHLKSRMEHISTLPDTLNYLTPPLIKASLHFGKNDLTTTETDLTTFSHSAVLQHYQYSWSD